MSATNPLYLVVDFEFTFCTRGSIPKGESEIIEVGAVLLHPTLGVLGQYQALIKPQWHPSLPCSVPKKTGLTDAMLAHGVTLEAALSGLCALLPENKHVLFVSWGKADYRHLRQECQAKGLVSPLTTLPTLNYQKRAAALMQLPRQQRNGMGLTVTLEALGLGSVGHAHRAFDDAMNTARIMQHLGN